MSISPGENVGPYRVIEQLGSGGMATVFKAYHPALDRYVAIKILHPAFKADPQFFERFQREARIVAKLEHPHIIPVYDFNEHHGEPYLVMRFVEGETLKPEMSGKLLPAAEILRLLRPICSALSYAHQQGVLHRDIKPSNIMVTTDGHIFLTDFGLARMVQAGESTLSQDMMIGTPQYISPEQAQGISQLDGRTDIYSLGVVLFEMFTGRVPFSADTPFATIHDHIYTPLPLPRTINPAIDPAVERLLLKALAKDPNDRFATADELLTALEKTLNPPAVPSSTARAVQPAAGRKDKLPWWIWAGGVALFLVIFVGIIGGARLWQRAQRAKQTETAQAVSTVPLALPTAEPAAAVTPEPAVSDTRAADLAQQAAAAMSQQQAERAIELYRQAMAADPHYLPAYFGLSNALRQQGDQASSIAALKEATAQNPQEADAWLRLGEAYLVNDQAEAALKAFEQATTLTPDSAGALARQAMALLALNQVDAAKTIIDTALTLDELNPEAHLAQAMYLFKTGDRRGTRRELQLLVQSGRAPFFVIERARQMLAGLNN
ncbi:MAG: protein kinase [Anaerolineae bacterium]|nr:protein kinase [Anaerolineae bacterium]